MDGDILVNDELRRRKRNNTRLCREEEDRQLIAEGEGKIGDDRWWRYADFLPAGPRKAKTTALKNASESCVLNAHI